MPFAHYASDETDKQNSKLGGKSGQRRTSWWSVSGRSKRSKDVAKAKMKKEKKKNAKHRKHRQYHQLQQTEEDEEDDAGASPINKDSGTGLLCPRCTVSFSSIAKLLVHQNACTDAPVTPDLSQRLKMQRDEFAILLDKNRSIHAQVRFF